MLQFLSLGRRHSSSHRLSLLSLLTNTLPGPSTSEVKTLWRYTNLFILLLLLLWPRRVNIPNSITIGSSVFAGFTLVTNRHALRHGIKSQKGCHSLTECRQGAHLYSLGEYYYFVCAASRCIFQPYDCIIIRFVEKIQSAFKFCQRARVDDVVYGLSLATIKGRRLGETPFMQVSTTWALTCPETVHQRPRMTREIETWLSDSRVGNNSVADADDQSSLHCIIVLTDVMSDHTLGHCADRTESLMDDWCDVRPTVTFPAIQHCHCFGRYSFL